MLSDELEMQAMTKSIAGEINSICMTKESCTFIHSISIDVVNLAVKKPKFHADLVAFCHSVMFVVLIYYIIILRYWLTVC